MDNHQQKAIINVVDSEGFEHAFVHYSDFDDIENEEFHTLRREYLKAREELAKIIGYVEE